MTALKIQQVETTRKFDKDYLNLPENIKKKTDEKLSLFLVNPLHPSLRVKKMQGYPDLWEASITMNYRFTFQISGDICFLRKIGTHDILSNP